MKVAIKPATLRDATYVAVNMREQDVREIQAVIDTHDRVQLAASLVYASQYVFVGAVDGQPVAVVGLARVFPHVLSGWAYGTKRMKRAIPALTRYMRTLGSELVERGYVRIEVKTMADHDLSHKWLTGMGAKLETPEPFVYGRNGEMFVQYGFSRDAAICPEV